MELHNAEESMAIRKILAHGIRMKKNSQTKEDAFWIADFYGVMRAQSPTCTEISLMTSLTPKLSICCYVFKYFLFTDLKKNALTLTENLLNFNGTYMGQKQPFESFLKNGCSE